MELAVRVLKPGGLLASFEMVVDAADWAKLPEDFRRTWEARSPFFTHGLQPFAERAGLATERAEGLPGRALRPDEGGLPAAADAHGVTLHVRYEYVLARKPNA